MAYGRFFYGLYNDCMCRVVGFVGTNGGVGQTSLLFEISKSLASKNFKVCVFDACFNNNAVIYKFKQKHQRDLAEYLLGDFSESFVLNKESRNLFFVKTNNRQFDYFEHMKLIKVFVEKIKNEFDYILFDINEKGAKMSEIFFCLNEVMIVSEDSKIAVMNAHRIIKQLSFFCNITNIKIIMNKVRVVNEIKGNALKPEDVELILGVDVLFTVPKFFKKNYFNYHYITKNQKIIIERLSNSFITNTNNVLEYEKKYKGVIGFFRKRITEKYE